MSQAQNLPTACYQRRRRGRPFSRLGLIHGYFGLIEGECGCGVEVWLAKKREDQRWKAKVREGESESESEGTRLEIPMLPYGYLPNPPNP